MTDPEPEYSSGPFEPGDSGTCRCAYPGCPGEVDVPPGTHDGATVACYTCEREHLVTAYAGGAWSLTTAERVDPPLPPGVEEVDLDG